MAKMFAVAEENLATPRISEAHDIAFAHHPLGMDMVVQKKRAWHLKASLAPAARQLPFNFTATPLRQFAQNPYRQPREFYELRSARL